MTIPKAPTNSNSWISALVESLFPRDSRRNAGLDLLRLAACLLVIFAHIDVCPLQTNAPLHQLTAFLQRGGWLGVDLFFVLSGFLVSGLFFKEFQASGSVSPGRFLWRRAFKIYPTFWIFILATTVWHIVWMDELESVHSMAELRHQSLWKEVLSELWFLQNYARHRLWVHNWTLAIEEPFYLR